MHPSHVVFYLILVLNLFLIYSSSCTNIIIYFDFDLKITQEIEYFRQPAYLRTNAGNFLPSISTNPHPQPQQQQQHQ